MGKIESYARLFREAVRIIRLYQNWPEIIANHFRAGRDTTELVMRSGARYGIRPRSTDMGLVYEICAQNIYQIRPGDIGDNAVVIDIGAHIGVFSVFAATRAKDVTVYCFEPDPDNFQQLLKNIKLNHLEDRIHPFNLAVSDTIGSKQLIRSASSESAHSLFSNKFSQGDVKDSVTVGCTTLTVIFERNAIKTCDVLKLDCEGEEYNILLKAPDGILSKVARIVGEYHDGLTSYTHQDLENFLARHDFAVRTRESQPFPNFRVGYINALRNTDRV